jgi:Ca2+/Na+ antiporter
LLNTKRKSNEVHEVATFDMLFSDYMYVCIYIYTVYIYISIRKGRKKKGKEQREKETERMLLAIEVVEN